MKRAASSLLGLVLAGLVAVAQDAPRATLAPVVSFDEKGAPSVTLLDAPPGVSLRASWGGEPHAFSLERSGPDAHATLAGAPPGTDVRYEVVSDGSVQGAWTLHTLPA